MVEGFANDFDTALSAAIVSTSATSISVVDAAPEELWGTQFRIRVGAIPTSVAPNPAFELMLVTDTGANGASPWTVEREIEETIALTHANGIPVTHLVTAGALKAFAVASEPAIQPAGYKRRSEVRSMVNAPASSVVVTLDGALVGAALAALATTPYRYENSDVYVGGFATPYYGQQNWRVAYDVFGRWHRVMTYGAGGRWRIWMNERPGAWQTTPNDAAVHYYLVDAGAVGYNRFVVEMDTPAPWSVPTYFGGVEVWPTDALIAPPSIADGFRLAFVGDSYTFGAGADSPAGGFAQTLGRLLGTPTTLNNGRIGSGLATAPIYSDSGRIATLVAFAPEVIVVQAGSTNDSAVGGTGVIGPAFATWVATVRAALPAAQIIAIGVIVPRAPTANEIAVNNDVKAAALADDVPFIDAIAATWFTGTGDTVAPTGTGNADVFSSGATPGHPSQAGHDYLAARLWRELVDILGDIAT